MVVEAHLVEGGGDRRNPGKNAGAVSQMVRRVEARMATDPEIGSGLATITLQLAAVTGTKTARAPIHPDDWLRKERLTLNRV